MANETENNIDLDANTETISNLFSKDRFFRIPNYQRPFSWKEDQFSDLISDIKNADRGQQYFLGSIVLYSKGDTLIVVDGQQRLTSLLILLACIRDKMESEDDKTELQEKIVQKERKIDGIPKRNRLEVRDAEIFDQVVILKGGTLKEVELKDFAEPERRYFSASKIFHEELAELDHSQLEELAQYISQKCVLVQLTTSNFDQAFRLFEVVNDRGKQLLRIDILKANNIAPDVITSDVVRDRIAKKWHDLENEIGEKDFEDVFFLVRLLLVKEKPQGDLLKEYDEKVFKKKIVRKGEPFANLIFDYIKLYRSIFIDMDYLSDGNDNWIKFQSLIFIMNNEFRASEWKACMLSFAKKFGRDKFYIFMLALESLFLTHWVASVRKDERYEDYTNLLDMIDNENDVEAIISSIPKNEDSIKKATSRNDFYNSGYCKYFLLRLELLTSELNAVRKFEAKSVEHVFPQNPREDAEWLKKTDGNEIPDFVHSIGNLVLISKSKNSSASNKEFEAKKTTYLNPRVSDYPRSIKILDYKDWDYKVIMDRTNAAADEILSSV